MNVIDVRKSMSYKYVPDTKENAMIRFQLTDHHYVAYNGRVSAAEAGLYWLTPSLQVQVKSGTDAEPMEYEVYMRYERHDTGDVRVFLFDEDQTVMPGRFNGFQFQPEQKRPVEFLFRITYPFVETLPIPKTLYEDFQRYVSIADITFVGSDGNVTVSKKIIKMRSPVLKTMFNQKTSKEYQSKEVDMTDFPKTVLEAFVKFLTEEQFVFPKNNACDLFKLADKYDIPSLKEVSGNYLLNNVTEENAGELYEIFDKISPNVVNPKDLFLKAYGNKE